jgi:hypothetical protein
MKTVLIRGKYCLASIVAGVDNLPKPFLLRSGEELNGHRAAATGVLLTPLAIHRLGLVPQFCLFFFFTFSTFLSWGSLPKVIQCDCAIDRPTLLSLQPMTVDRNSRHFLISEMTTRTSLSGYTHETANTAVCVFYKKR